MSRAALLTQLRERVLARIQRGPLLDISIGRSARRFDLLELGNDDPSRAYQALDYVVSRRALRLTLPILEDEDQGISQEDVDANIAVLKKIENIKRTVSLYQRETGVNPLYLAFPLLLLRERDVGGNKGRCIVAPLFVWPLSLEASRAKQGEVLIAFDRERGLVHENPALNPWLKDHFGIDIPLEKLAEELTATEQLTVQHVSVAAAKALEGFQRVVVMRTEAPLMSVPSKDLTIPPNEPRLYQSAAVSVVDWVHQSTVNELATLAADPSDMDVLDTFLGLRAPLSDNETIDDNVPESERFFVADADPAQQLAVFRARRKSGLLIHGPPGTGKSQTIVNVVIDAVARGEKVLVVCQKQAAINVVSKRLAKVGLRDVGVVVHDAMKERVGIIEQLKTQIGTWRPSQSANVEQRRNIVCSQIVEIEKELRGYNQALWTSQARNALSYRTVLARLVSVRSHPTLPASQAELRPLLLDLSYDQVQEVKDRLAEITPVWERAPLTKNLWRFVKPFDFNDESRRELTALLQSIKKVVDTRDNHIQKTGELVTNISRAEVETWLGDYGALFSEMDPASTDWLLRWRDFVIGSGEPRTAPQVLQRLRTALNNLTPLRNSESQMPWLDKLWHLQTAQLQELQENCDAFIHRTGRWFRKLLPLRKQVRSALKLQADELGVKGDAMFVRPVAPALQLPLAVTRGRGGSRSHAVPIGSRSLSMETQRNSDP